MDAQQHRTSFAKLGHAVLTIAVFAMPLLFWLFLRSSNTVQIVETRPIATVLPVSRLHLAAEPLPESSDIRPRVTNVRIVDLDSNQHADLLVCDAVRHTVWWYTRSSSGVWDRRPLVPENSIAAPAHAEVTDIDNDGDMDVVVAGLHSVWPTDSRMGNVTVLLNSGDMEFSTVLLADDLRRVADVQPADLDGDGDVDLAVAEFGYLHGRVLWLENKGGLQFADHELLSLPGCIHVPIADYDGDGDPDIAALISQNDEEVWMIENTRESVFQLKPRRVWGTSDFDRGLAGMVKVDLDQDGDQDFLLSAGDNLELTYPCPQPEHGCIWLENRGKFDFAEHQIGFLGGTYTADAADMDGDGDMDVVLASMFNDWKEPGATSLAWLENDGQQKFSAWHLASSPTRLCTIACGDLNADNMPDIVAGSLQLYPPYQPFIDGVAVWQNSPDVEATR